VSLLFLSVAGAVSQTAPLEANARRVDVYSDRPRAASPPASTPLLGTGPRSG
jgi:hypothetical protein